MALSADAYIPPRGPKAPPLVYKRFGDLSCSLSYLVCSNCSYVQHFCTCSDEVRDVKNA